MDEQFTRSNGMERWSRWEGWFERMQSSGERSEDIKAASTARSA
jgi:hypothetical protein